MTTVTRTEITNLTLEVEIEPGKRVEFRCSDHTQTFALNRIPMASCGLAVGRDVRTLEAAAIHSEFPNLQRMLPARVWFHPSGTWAAHTKRRGDGPLDAGLWSKAGPQVIFDGYVAGPGYSKVERSFQMTVQLIHWLADLGFSSVFSNQSHPEAPSQLSFAATFLTDIGVAATQAPSSFISGTKFASDFTPASIAVDLWSALAEVFCRISKQDMIRLGPDAACSGLPGDNNFSLAALARFEGLHSCRTVQNKWHVPLSLQSVGTLRPLVADSISRYVGWQSTLSWWATTIWDKLVHDFCPSFLFQVVPRVNSAVAAPVAPGLRKPWRVTVVPEDFSNLQFSSYTRRPIRGVGVFSSRELATVAGDRQGQDPSAQIGLGGCFLPDSSVRGMILMQRMPGWLQNVPAFAMDPTTIAFGTLPEGGRRSPGSSTTPKAPLPRTQGGPAPIAVMTADLHGRMAHYYYVLEALRGRTGQLVGKLRFDIAPGCNLSIKNVGEQFLEDMEVRKGEPVDLAAPDLFGTVIQVQNVISASQHSANTVLHLGHLRTDTENMDDRTSLADHPLYVTPEGKQPFTGAPLVDAYLFD